jgi:hypothetical protein
MLHAVRKLSVFDQRVGRAAVAAFAAMAAMFGVALMLPATANAQPAYASAGSPTLSTTSPAPGGALAVAGDGFAGGSVVRVVMYSEPVVLGTATADAAGEVSIDVKVPSTFEPGAEHRVELQGVDSSGAVRVLSQVVTLAGGGDDVLARTGVAVVPLVAVAGGLLVLGGALVATGRVGRKTTTG